MGRKGRRRRWRQFFCTKVNAGNAKNLGRLLQTEKSEFSEAVMPHLLQTTEMKANDTQKFEIKLH